MVSILVRTFELQSCWHIIDKKFSLFDKLTNTVYISRIVYLVGIFSFSTNHDLSPQRKEVNIYQAKDKMVLSLHKLQCWILFVEEIIFF